MKLVVMRVFCINTCMKRIANPIQTTDLCSYGCGSTANFINGSNKLMCCKSSNSCPENKRKNSQGLKNCGRDYVESYKNLSQASKDGMNWSKGLTKETNSSIAAAALKLLGRPGISRPHTEETKQKLSKFRSEWLRNPDNRKNLGRHKRSWMELTFDSYLTDNNVVGWDTEIHFWNPVTKKNYFTDYLFANKMLIIELDGTQHRKTVDNDRIRDEYLSTLGYTVIRVPYAEFKERYFSGKGFLDLLGS